jgi:hypothetical protein
VYGVVTSPTGRVGLADEALEPSFLGKAVGGYSGSSYITLSKIDMIVQAESGNIHV